MIMTITTLSSVLISIFIFALVTTLLVGRRIVHDYEAALIYRNGRYRKTLGGGAYWVLRPRTELVLIDLRETLLLVQGQEILTGDNVALRLSVAASYRIEEPRLAVEAVESYTDAMHVAIQLAVRSVISNLEVDEVMARRDQIGTLMHERLVADLERIGVRLVQVDLRDLTFPGELKQVFSAVIQARKEAQAQLERARGETAALRHLANVAKMIEDRPSLAGVRWMQAVDQASKGYGNTFVIGVPGSVLPDSMKGAG